MIMTTNRSGRGERIANIRVADSLSFLINKLAQLAGRKMAEALQPLQMQARESGILAAIAQLGPMSQQQLGEVLLIDRTTMVLSIDRLEELDFVERAAHPKDRRVSLIRLTRRGEGAMLEAKRRLEECEAALLTPLDAEEQTRFRESLFRIIQGVLAPEVQARQGPRPITKPRPKTKKRGRRSS